MANRITKYFDIFENFDFLIIFDRIIPQVSVKTTRKIKSFDRVEFFETFWKMEIQI